MSFLATWARVVGAAAARRALPVWSGLAILAAVVFGGTAMHPHALTAAALDGWRFALGLAATWLALTVPIGRAMLEPTATAWLRALPVPRWRRWVVTGVIAAAAQAPWTVLWGMGEGAGAAVVATAGAAAAMLAIAEVAGRIAIVPRRPRWRGALGALLGVHRRLLVRGRGSAAVRAVGVAWLGGALLGLIARANQLDGDETVWWGLAIAAVALPIAVGGFAGPVVDGDRRLGWILIASGCSWPVRVLASAIVLGVIGAALGGVVTAGAALIGDGASLALAGWLGLFGVAIGGLALRAGAWAYAHDDGDRIVIAMAGVAIASFLAIGVMGPVGVIAVLAAGVASVLGLVARRAEGAT